jgi:hypothetical protein
VANASGTPYRFGLLLTVGLFALAAGVSVWGIRRGGVTDLAAPESSPAPAGPLTSIVLPDEEPVLPPGRHREQFQAACSQCHSTRLVLTQPVLTEQQWVASVKKMVTVYGAPLSDKQEQEVVTYLLAIQGRPVALAGR